MKFQDTETHMIPINGVRYCDIILNYTLYMRINNSALQISMIEWIILNGF